MNLPEVQVAVRVSTQRADDLLQRWYDLTAGRLPEDDAFLLLQGETLAFLDGWEATPNGVLGSVIATLEDAENNQATPAEWERQARAALALYRTCREMSPGDRVAKVQGATRMSESTHALELDVLEQHAHDGDRVRFTLVVNIEDRVRGDVDLALALEHLDRAVVRLIGQRLGLSAEVVTHGETGWEVQE